MRRIHCPNCHYQGKSKTYTPGTFVVELVLWLCFLLPGLIYSLWRVSAKYQGCPVCRWRHVMPLKHYRAMQTAS